MFNDVQQPTVMQLPDVIFYHDNHIGKKCRRPAIAMHTPLDIGILYSPKYFITHFPHFT